MNPVDTITIFAIVVLIIVTLAGAITLGCISRDLRGPRDRR